MTLGFAISFAFVRGDDVYRGVFMPSVTYSGVKTAPTYAYKTTAKGQKRAWTVTRNTTYLSLTGHPSDPSSKVGSEELSQLEGVSSYMKEVISDPFWSLAAFFPLEILPADFLELKENPLRVPPRINGLMTRRFEQEGIL